MRNPEFQQVKALYQERLEKIDAEAFNTKIDNLTDCIDGIGIPKQIQKQINELLDRQRELANKGFRNATADEIEFENYLQEFLSIQSRSNKPHVKVWLKRLHEFSEATDTPLTYDPSPRHSTPPTLTT